ncbi:MAG: hypothetical protein ABEJ89_00525 [Haloarculaceae archaeon]
MNASFVAGLLLTGAGLVGYLVGVAVAYPGRAFSLTALMLGVALAVVSRGREAER